MYIIIADIGHKHYSFLSIVWTLVRKVIKKKKERRKVDNTKGKEIVKEKNNDR